MILTCLPIGPVRLRKLRIRFVSLCSRAILFFFRIRRTQSGLARRPVDQTHGSLILSNHLSILDILVVSATRPCCFVTSKDMEETPGAGFLAKVGGSLFVERRNRMSVEADSKMMAEVLSQGIDVVLYPEGTSGDGTAILPFKAGLMKSAIAVGASVQPIRIQYETLGGKPVTTENAPRLFYYGEITLFQHIARVATNPPVVVDVKWLEAIPSAKELDPRAIANQMRERIVENYRPVRAPTPKEVPCAPSSTPT